MSVAQMEYRACPGHDGYLVGSDGSVWSLWKFNGYGYYISNIRRQLKPGVYKKTGHLYVCLSGKCVAVHRLVLEAFAGPCPPGKESRHFPDRTPANCRIENLQWGTRLENMQDKQIHGTEWDRTGSFNPKAKLTEESVREIKQLYANGGWSYRALGMKFNVSRITICHIFAGRSWSHVV